MKLKHIFKLLSFFIVFFVLFTGIFLQPVKADGYKDRSLFFPRETYISGKSSYDLIRQENPKNTVSRNYIYNNHYFFYECDEYDEYDNYDDECDEY
jgi:hypothetical protein